LRELDPERVYSSGTLRSRIPDSALRWMHTRYMPGLSKEQKPPTVLLIDDDQVSREVAAALLSSNGYSVRTAENGAAALEMLGAAEFEPDGILMDVHMPGLKTTPLIAKLRDRSKAKIIAMSGSKPRVKDVPGADGFLLKPFAAKAVTALLKGETCSQTAPRPRRDDAPVISAETLAKLRKLMPESAVREIYQTVVSDLERRICAVETAIAGGDAAEVSRIGHAIKGSCGMAGALEASRVGALLEAAAKGTARRQKSNEWGNSTSLGLELRTAVRNLKAMIEGDLLP
jgi:CheY-like chemotaxis protein